MLLRKLQLAMLSLFSHSCTHFRVLGLCVQNLGFLGVLRINLLADNECDKIVFSKLYIRFCSIQHPENNSLTRFELLMFSYPKRKELLIAVNLKVASALQKKVAEF